jgi:WhiB family redox-sensing transcriptional regulator
MRSADERFWAALLRAHDLPELADLVSRPRWMAEAACRNHPEASFFPVRGESTGAAAKAVCRGCRVRAECYAYAVDHDELGIWGGTSERERRHTTRRSAAS